MICWLVHLDACLYQITVTVHWGAFLPRFQQRILVNICVWTLTCGNNAEWYAARIVQNIYFLFCVMFLCLRKVSVMSLFTFTARWFQLKKILLHESKRYRAKHFLDEYPTMHRSLVGRRLMRLFVKWLTGCWLAVVDALKWLHWRLLDAVIT